ALTTGQASIEAGDLIITNEANAAYLAIRSGNFALQGGTLTTDSLLLTNSSGHMLFNGGTLHTKSTTVSNGLPLTVGDGVRPSTLDLLGGTYCFANGLVIANNAMLTGCGVM